MSLHIFNCIYIDGFVAVWKQKPAVASQRYVFVSAVTFDFEFTYSYSGVLQNIFSKIAKLPWNDGRRALFE